MKKTFLFAFALIFIIAGALFSIRHYNQYRYHLEKQTLFTMDTFVTVYAIGPEKIAKPAINLALEKIQEINDKFDALDPRGQIYRFNHENEPIDDPEILKVVEIALRISEETDGAFDITVSPLIELWGFYGDRPRLPGHTEIRACLEKVGFRKLEPGPAGLEKKERGVQIDLGAIAKGYAVARAVETLQKQGVESALIDAGGDIHALGKRGTRPWNVGIKDPRREDLLGYIEVENASVMGSGDYERFFMKNGKRYHHIFNPKTGYPAEGMSGITLIYPDATLADAWNTALFVMGPEKAMEFVEKTEGMEAILVTGLGEVRFSSGLKNALNAVSKEKK